MIKAASGATDSDWGGNAEMGPMGRFLFNLRWTRLGLSQAAFADRYGLPLKTIQNVEQQRFAVTPAMRLALAAIDADPVMMAGVAQRLSPRGA